jgi:hypothetical protein
MTKSGNKEQHHFNLAFDLAYCIHVNKEIAFFVAEDALEGLETMLGYHKKNRGPSQGLRGFLKSGERARPIRKTMTLNEPQMLQWLVYKHSEFWERQSERGEGFYLPTDEDLIVRYIEYLVFITLRRGSFYSTLAIGSLLHQFDRRETRLFYDILTQSDSARMKDMNYIGKQRLEMLEKVSNRFGDMIETVTKPGAEKQFVMRPTSESVVSLIRESLKRFTPWETTCVVEPGFEVTDVSGLYFPEGSANDEELIELNRIHTVLDPVCFAKFVDGLSRYVRTLPGEDQDKACNYGSLDDRVRVPQFSNFPSGSSRGDRFQPPNLTTEDYVRLQRTLASRAQRRKVFSPGQLRIYLDDTLSYSLDLTKTSSGRWLIDQATVIEIRGEDVDGELTLATLVLRDAQIDGVFKDAFIQPGGQKLNVWLTPEYDAEGAFNGNRLEVSHEPSGLGWGISQWVISAWSGLTGTRKDHDRVWLTSRPDHSWWVKASAVTALLVVAAALSWWLLSPRSPRPEIRPDDEAGPLASPPRGGETPVSSATPSPAPGASPVKEVRPLLAQATWSMDRDSAQRAVSLERTRGEVQTLDLSRQQMNVLLSVPLYDDQGRRYTRYRVNLSAAGTRNWQQTLRSPRVSLTGYAHILDVKIFPQQLPGDGPYQLEVEGNIKEGWRPLGMVTLNPTK